MDKYLFRDILVYVFFPFLAAKYSFDSVLLQDNDAKHLSRLSNAILMENNINWVQKFYLVFKTNSGKI